MAVELETLAVKVDAAQATQNVEKLGRALDRTGDQADVTARQFVQTEAAAARMGSAASTAAAAAQASGARYGSAGRHLATFATQLASTGNLSMRAATDMAQSSVAMGAAFGPGSIAAIAVLGFASTAIGEWRRMRDEAAQTAAEVKQSLDDMVNRGAAGELRTMVHTIFEGTPAREFADGLRAAEERLATLQQRVKDMGAAGELGRIFNARPIREAQTEVDRLRKQLEQVRALIVNPANAPRSTSGPLPIRITATRDGRDEFAAWQAARAQAAERARWENEAILRAVRLGDARFRAENPTGPARPGAGVTSLGWDEKFRTLGQGVTSLPPFMRIDSKEYADSAGSAARAAAEQVLAAERELADERASIQENFLRGSQSAFAEFFRNVGKSGRDAWRDLWGNFKDTALSVASELAAKRLTEMIFAPAQSAATAAAKTGQAAGGASLFSKLLNPAVLGLAIGGFTLSQMFRRSGPSYRANRTPGYNENGQDPRQIAAREWLAAQNGGAERADLENQVRQSVGGLLTQTSAMRVVSILESIRIGVNETNRLLASGAAGGFTVNATMQPGTSPGANVAELVDRVMGGRTKQLQLASGAAVIP